MIDEEALARLKAEIARLRAEVEARLKAENARLRAELGALRRELEASRPKTGGGIVNQCDGCRSGRPLDENGNHVMGDGPYDDLMACQRSKYEPGDKP